MPNINAHAVGVVLLLGCAVDARRLPVVEDERAPLQTPDAARALDRAACPDGPDCEPDASDRASSAVVASLPPSLDTPDAGACDPADGGCLSPCDGCRIDGACFAAGLQNPATLCQICDPARDPGAWSANDGLICDDERYCTELAACSGGECVRVLERDCGSDSCSEARRGCYCSGDC